MQTLIETARTLLYKASFSVTTILHILYDVEAEGHLIQSGTSLTFMLEVFTV